MPEPQTVAGAGAVVLTNGALQLRFARQPAGYRFTSWVRVHDRWVGAALWPNALGEGVLALVPASIEASDGLWRVRGEGAGTGLDGSRVGYGWSGSIAPAAGDGWSVDVAFDIPVPLRGPASLVLWLGGLSTMRDRQALTWRRTFVAGPTRNGQGLPGNDLPALYLLDPATGIETILAYDAEALSWAPDRLLTLQCRELYEYGPSPRYGVGLTGAPGPLPAGAHRIRWQIWQRFSGENPDGWEAVARLTQTLAPVLDGQGAPPPRGLSWGRVAAGALSDLSNSEQAWVELRDSTGPVLGLRAYVRDVPHLYESAPDHFELMTVADVLPPLLLYLRLHPDSGAAALAHRLGEGVFGFHLPQLHMIANRYPLRAEDTVADLWYFLENGLIKLGWLAMLTGDTALQAMVLDGIEGARRLGRRVQDRFPLFADFDGPDGPTPVGALPNYSAAGMYAFAAMLAVSRGEERYRDEARRALAGLRFLPVELMYHEPQQLAFAAAAAALLAADGDRDMAGFADRLVRAQLRMAYWHEDPYAIEHGYRIRGLFQACASLLYPAFKEEGESILPWVVLLRRGIGPTELLLKFMNLGRRHSFAFFDACRQEGLRGAAVCPFIPYENLGTSELPQTGAIGKEIYGAGEVFWFYLMFEALGRADSDAICCVFLDLLEPQVLAAFPPARRRFLIYNPEPRLRHFRFHAPHLSRGRYELSWSGLVADADQLAAGVPMSLEGGAWRELEIVPRAV